MLPLKAVDVTCPLCGAEPGSSCFIQGVIVKRPIPLPHASRVKLAEELNRGQGPSESTP